MGVEYSKETIKRMNKAKQRQTARWRRKNGPVTTRFVCPICGAGHSRADHKAP